MKLLAFHGKPEIKESYLARVRAHRVADEIIHGRYWQDGRGCAIGCTIHSGNHSAYETELGIPIKLAYLEDGIFEAMSSGRAKSWPEDFLSAIPVNADLSLVWPRFILWMLIDDEWGVIKLVTNSDTKEYIQSVADQYTIISAGGLPDWNKSDKLWAARAAQAAPQAAWVAPQVAQAARDARAAARDAQAARAAWAAQAARDAWDARVAQVAWAAWDARDARAAWAAWDAYTKAQADKLLQLLAASDVQP